MMTIIANVEFILTLLFDIKIFRHIVPILFKTINFDPV